MAAKQTGLGRGLGALIREIPATVETSAPAASEASPGTGVRELPPGSIRKNPFQPRLRMREAPLEELAASVREKGVLQPLLVRKKGADAYELIAGERRLRAAQLAGLTSVPVLVVEASDGEALELALIENLQREDLDPMEEARGYRALMEQFSLTQEQAAQRVGKARSTVTNALRLLDLPEEIQQKLADGKLSAGHAKALLGLELAEEQRLLSERVVREGLSVRALEKLVAQARRPPRKPRARKLDMPEPYVRHINDRLQQHLGTAVHVPPSFSLANGERRPGRIEIDYYDNQDLERLLGLLGVTDLA